MMTKVKKIEKLEEVLQNLGPEKKIIDYQTSRLTAAGENYGSLMLRLEVKVFNEKTKAEENLDLVAKLLPPNEILHKIFNVQVTYKNEAALYSVIVPVLKEFQKEQGASGIVDVFAKFYGTRISLDPKSEKVDDDAVLILENLKTQGFSTTTSRTVGFDLETTRLLVNNLAHFHAVPLALKLKKPDVFEKKVKPHLADFNIRDVGLDDVVKRTVNILKENERCLPYLKRVEELLRQKSLKTPHEPFATILHNDYWVNNMMVKYENGKPVANRMVDFQVIEYMSPCRDLIFFLFTSVELQVLKQHLDDIIDLYYESFIEKLEELKCDVVSFSREAYEKELKLAATEAEYFHVVFMLYPIYADQSDIKELSDISPDDLTSEKILSPALKERMLEVTLEFIRKGWLDK